MPGYKAFKPDFTGYGGYQFTVGNTYYHTGTIKPCESGFHFSYFPIDVLDFFGPTTRYAIVEPSGNIDTTESYKSVCSQIYIVNEITKEELKSFQPLYIQRVDGTQEWYNSDCKLHRGGDQPAIIRADGAILYYNNGLIHRDNDNPAVTYASGTMMWYRNGLFHRENDQPAVVYNEPCFNTAREWYYNGKLIKTINMKQII
jgi:hypothetical protein